MAKDISEADARLALRSIEDQHQQVIAQIDLPRWYWWGLATAWLLLGVATDLGNAWVAAGATLLFGAVHSAVAQLVFSGRRKSARLSVRADVVSRRLPLVLFGCLIALVAINIGVSFAVNADGADHPSIIGATFAATIILCGGPTLMAALRIRMTRNVNP